MRYLLTFLLAAVASCVPVPVVPVPVPVAAGVTPRPPDRDAALGPMVDSFVAGFGRRWGEAYAPSGYITVARDGQVIFAKSYGKANRDKHLTADADTRFRIGSLTKQFTAAAILQLAAKGKLRLDASIRTYLPEYPRTGDGITIHHLLTHTSGIPEYDADETLKKDRARRHTRAEVLASFQNKPLDFKPGERFSYSNSGYVVLGQIIERISGKSYENYLQENVLLPAGMTHTTTVDAPDAPDAAIGYLADRLENLVPAPPADMSISFAAGALRSTARDLLAWDRALAGTAILDEASKRRMFTPDKGDYAYGWNVAHEAGREVLWHEGRVDGFTSYIGRAPDAGLVVIGLFNNEGLEPGKIAAPILRMALTGKAESPPDERSFIALDSTTLFTLAGDYRLGDASRKEAEAKFPQGLVEQVLLVSITTERDALYLKPTGQPDVQLFGDGHGVFFTKRDDVELVPDIASSPTDPMVYRFTLSQAGFSAVYERLLR